MDTDKIASLEAIQHDARRMAVYNVWSAAKIWLADTQAKSTRSDLIKAVEWADKVHED